MKNRSNVILEEYENIKEDKLNYDDYVGKGAAFIVTPVNEGQIFSRENLTEDHELIESSAKEFGVKRILPVNEELNKLNKDLTFDIFREVGELGFLGIDIPEEYGGSMLDKVTACLVIEGLCSGKNASINVTISAHSGIATLPIVWYGNEDQKKKYLPKMASGEWMGCYALTEPNAGSDAMAGEMSARLNDEKTHYLLNGQKIYITNGSWSDVCVTFAKVDGVKYTAFIVDKDCPGWTKGEEEHKMGIKGSSTTTLYFEDCKVPVENVLGKVGQGGAIAFNGLYVGRYKLGAATAAGSKSAIKEALDFANDREQFNRSISKFGMLQKKFADMVIRAWEADTIVYMTAGSIDKFLNNVPHDEKYFDVLQKSIEDHAIEASIAKIIGSEALWKNVDDGVQILGGAGYIEEYGFAVLYRDERINRIFEGTNEVNRLIIGGYTLKKSILEELPIRNMINQCKTTSWVNRVEMDNVQLQESCNIVEFSRSAVLFTLDELILKYGQDFKNEQWVLEPFADMVICLSLMDTGFKRVRQLDVNSEKYKNMKLVMDACVYLRFSELINHCKDIIRNIDRSGSPLMQKLNNELNDLVIEKDIISLKQEIANVLYNKKEYFLD